MAKMSYGIAADYLVREENLPLPPEGWIDQPPASWDRFFSQAQRELKTLLDCADPSVEGQLIEAEFRAMHEVRQQLEWEAGEPSLIAAYELEDSPEEFIERPTLPGGRFRTGFLGGFTFANQESVLTDRSTRSSPQPAIIAQARESLNFGAYEKTRYIFKLKAILNRARPFQYAGLYSDESLGFRMLASHTAWSGSAPSGHCIESAMAAVATLVAFRGLLPVLAKEEQRLMSWAARSGDLRVWAGLHFVTDNIISFTLALRSVNYVFIESEQSYARGLLKQIIATSISVQVARKLISAQGQETEHPFEPFLRMLDAELSERNANVPHA
jgi:hypothetical protein